MAKIDIEKIYNESHEIYGSPKITQILNKNGEKVFEMPEVC